MTAPYLQPPRRRAVTASAVCLGHALLLLAIWQARQAPPGDAAEALRSIAVRLLPERRERTAREPVAAPQRARAAARVPVTPVDLFTPVEAAAPAEPQAPADATGQPGPSGTAAAIPGTTTGPAPLALKPQRDVMLGALTNPAVNDPRSNSPKPTFEERIAMGLDPELCVKLERLPDGSIHRSMGKLQRAQSAIQNTYGTGPHGIKVCR